MAQYTLTSKERDLLEEWYDEYLTRIQAPADVDLARWLDTTPPTTAREVWDGAGLIWWALHNENRTIRRLPPQASAWKQLLTLWLESLPPDDQQQRTLFEKLVAVL